MKKLLFALLALMLIATLVPYSNSSPPGLTGIDLAINLDYFIHCSEQRFF